MLLFSAGLLLWDLHSGRPLTKHEVLAAQPAREMVQGRGWVVPLFLGVPRTAKPPTMSWLIAGSMKLLGGQSEIAARLPAALSGVATAWLIAMLTGRWYGSRTGLLAGLLLPTSVYVIMQARLAEADMPLCAAVTAAMTVFGFTAVPTPLRGDDLPTLARPAFCWRAVLFHGCAGVSFLLKGPVGLLFIILACLPYALIARWRWRQSLPLRLLGHPVGLVLLLILMVAWPVSAYLTYPPILQAWREQTLGRVAGELGGKRPFLFYFYTLPWLTLPGALFAVFAIRRFRAVQRPQGLFLLLWVVGGMVVLQASAFKHKHYLIPLLPPVSVAAAIGLVDWVAMRYRCQRRRGSELVTGIMLTLLAGAAAAFGVTRFTPTDLRFVLYVLAAALGMLTIGLLWFEARRQLHLQLGCFFAIIWLVEIVTVSKLVPRFDTYQEYTRFAVRTRARLDESAVAGSAAPRLYLFELGETQLAFYLPLNTRRVDSPEALLTALSAHRGQEPLLVAATKRSLDQLMLHSPAVKCNLLDQAGLGRREKAADQLLLVSLWLETPSTGGSPPPPAR